MYTTKIWNKGVEEITAINTKNKIFKASRIFKRNFFVNYLKKVNEVQNFCLAALDMEYPKEINSATIKYSEETSKKAERIALSSQFRAFLWFHI